MFHTQRPPHVRARPSGDGAGAVVHRLNAAMAATMGDPHASPFHHPKTGIMAEPLPYEMPSLETAMTTRPAGPGANVATKLYDPYEAAVEEANRTQLYAGMPFRGKMRKAVSLSR